MRHRGTSGEDGTVLRDFPLSAALSARLAAHRADASAVRAVPVVPPVPARDAATVMLVDDLPEGGVRVIAFRRHRSLAFAPGMLVFPGGAVEPADHALARALGGPDAVGGPLDGVLVAAVRETFEECGVLIAVPEDASSPVPAPGLAEAREALLAGRTDLAGVLRSTGTGLRAGLLRPWAHWITPDFESRRFDTRFFVAAMPAGQQVQTFGREAEDGMDGVDGPATARAEGGWFGAAAAVARHRAGDLAMLPPTLVCLEELAAASSVAAVLAVPRRPQPVLPWPVEVPGADGAGRMVLRVDLDGAGGGRAP
ncbi:MAG: NUDIX hydrolase [Kineosporiaceae bacterium]|nr:NUDIX hydrolase [Kineosporiaceae bacterium]